MSTSTLPEHQRDANENMVSYVVQDPASRLFYWIIVCLEGEIYPLLEAKCLMVCVVIKGDYTSPKTAIAFICKVAAPLSLGFIKNACFGSAVAKVGQDAWQGQKVTCTSEKSSHFSKSPLHFAVVSPLAEQHQLPIRLPGGCCSPVCLSQAHHVDGSFCLPLLLHPPGHALSLRCCLSQLSPSNLTLVPGGSEALAAPFAQPAGCRGFVGSYAAISIRCETHADFSGKAQ